MADIRNFAEWDPGVTSSVQVEGDGPGPRAVYDVTVTAVRGTMTLRYRVLDYDEPNRLVIEAQSRTLVSKDTIVVTPTAAGSAVTYEATLRFRGILGPASLVLGPSFQRIARRAGSGLRRVLTERAQR